MANVKEQLQQLVISHGVNAERGTECAEQLLNALGIKTIQQILTSPNLKARANLHQPPIRVVTVDELRQQIMQKANNHQQVGRQVNKVKGPKHPKNQVRLTAYRLAIPSAVFRQEDGQEVAQISSNEVGPTAQGVVLMNVEEAIPYFGLHAAVSPHGIALLILDHDGSRVPPKCPVASVPAKCIGEPMIVSTAVLQIGEQQVVRNLPQNCLQVQEVYNQLVRIQVYQDQRSMERKEFIQRPVKNLISMKPFSEMEGHAILDVWVRQYMTTRMNKVPVHEAQLFLVNMRMDANAVETLMKENGMDGKYFEGEES